MPNPVIRLDAIRLDSTQRQLESLVAALKGLLRAQGREVDGAELACALGTAVMTSFAPGAPARQAWNVHGRHAFLVEAANLYGMELRALHPPEAAPLPVTPPEFEGHWRDSYVPFVRESLARQEPLLAWMGWPPPHDFEWGIMVACDESARCSGLVPGGDRAIEQVAAPVQAYHVVNRGGQGPDLDTLATVALERMRAVLADRLPAAMGVSTGPRAIRAFLDQVDRRSASAPGSKPGPVGIRAFARFLADRRAEARQFLSRAQGRAYGPNQAAVRGVLRILGDIVDGIEAALKTTAQKSTSREADEHIAAAIGKAADLEARLLESLG